MGRRPPPRVPLQEARRGTGKRKWKKKRRAEARPLQQQGEHCTVGSFAVAAVSVGAAVSCSPISVTVGAQDAGEDLAGVGLFCAGDEFGRALSHDAAAAFAAFGAEVDDPISLFDDDEMVLDDEHGVAEIDEALQNVEKFSHVVEVQAGGGLIEDVERAAGLALGKLAGQLDALGFAAGKSCGGLTEGDVAEADFDESRKFLLNLRNIFEEFQRGA